MRGYARFSADRVAALGGGDGVSQLLGQGHFAMTIDRGSETERYQGVVPLEGESLTEAADTYFRQSEQLPTFIRLAVAKHYRAGQAERPWTWRAGGLLVQKLTREGGHGPSVGDFEEEDWMRARALAETVEDHELLDPLLPPDRLLYRLFHEEQVRAYRCDQSRDLLQLLARARGRAAAALHQRRFEGHGGRRRGVGHLRVLQQPLPLRPGLFHQSDDGSKHLRMLRHRPGLSRPSTSSLQLN